MEHRCYIVQRRSLGECQKAEEGHATVVGASIERLIAFVAHDRVALSFDRSFRPTEGGAIGGGRLSGGSLKNHL
jgi:hypothetical protein